jgi:hypothetical protein
MALFNITPMLSPSSVTSILDSNKSDCIPAYGRALVHLLDGFCVEILSHLYTTWTAKKIAVSEVKQL